MNRLTFEKLRDLPDKEIRDDILFKKENTNTLIFDNIRVYNSMGIDLLLNGTYKGSGKKYKLPRYYGLSLRDKRVL